MAAVTTADDQRKDVILKTIANVLALFNSSSSSESSGEELEALEHVFVHRDRRKRPRRATPRVHNYVEEIMPQWLGSDFKSHFRMEKETFEYLLSILGTSLSRKHPGTNMISAEKQLLLAIWRAATPDSYRSICEKFNVSRATAVETVHRVTRSLVRLAPAVIRWPNRNEAEECWMGFESISAFPKVLGAIDGTHIHIPAPRVNPESYVNRKGYHSIHLQAVCNHKARFLHCFAGHAGSVHDQRVFHLSEVQDYLGDEDKFPDDCHLVGDPAYKLHSNLLVPYRDNGHLTERQSNYNFSLSSARIAIERAFGMLKGRFRSLLHCLAMTKTENVSDFVLACCVLHNICIIKDDELNIDLDQVVNAPHEGGVYQANHENVAAAHAKRDLICERLIRRVV